MPSFDQTIAFPTRIGKVVVRKAKASNAEFNEGYEKGWDAGYQASQWQGELETKKQLEIQAAQTGEWIKKLEALHEELSKAVSSHLPQLVLAALSRVMQHHKFTDEEILNEIQAMLQELSLAKTISIECSQNDMEKLQKQLDAAGVSLTQGQVQWTANPAFHDGEYVMQSDLGVLDGRRSTRVAHVHAALRQLL